MSKNIQISGDVSGVTMCTTRSQTRRNAEKHAENLVLQLKSNKRRKEDEVSSSIDESPVCKKPKVDENIDAKFESDVVVVGTKFWRLDFLRSLVSMVCNVY